VLESAFVAADTGFQVCLVGFADCPEFSFHAVVFFSDSADAGLAKVAIFTTHAWR
jgi:hypothetical protein